MSITEFSTDGSKREFDKHFKHKSKQELIYLLWDAYGHTEELDKQIAELNEEIDALEDELLEAKRDLNGAL